MHPAGAVVEGEGFTAHWDIAGVEAAADDVAGLQHGDLVAVLDEGFGCAEAADTRTDNDCCGHL